MPGNAGGPDIKINQFSKVNNKMLSVPLPEFKQTKGWLLLLGYCASCQVGPGKVNWRPGWHYKILLFSY